MNKMTLQYQIDIFTITAEMYATWAGRGAADFYTPSKCARHILGICNAVTLDTSIISAGAEAIRKMEDDDDGYYEDVARSLHHERTL